MRRIEIAPFTFPIRLECDREVLVELKWCSEWGLYHFPTIRDFVEVDGTRYSVHEIVHKYNNDAEAAGEPLSITIRLWKP